jgi:hypothetical protein
MNNLKGDKIKAKFGLFSMSETDIEMMRATKKRR